MAGLELTASARKVGRWAGLGVAGLGLVYLAPLVVGLLSLASPDDPIGDPWFTILELLILAMMPCIVALFVAVHAWAAPAHRVYSLLAVIFASLLAGLTCSVHFAILTLGHHPAFASPPWQPHVLSFTWPSVVYALDILAWDVFFPLAALFAAPVFPGHATWIRRLLILAGLLALAGLSGVALADMRWRNLGILGYAVVFPLAALLLARLFHRTPPSPTAA